VYATTFTDEDVQRVRDPRWRRHWGGWQLAVMIVETLGLRGYEEGS
jgi:hypothetical protein